MIGQTRPPAFPPVPHRILPLSSTTPQAASTSPMQPSTGPSPTPGAKLQMLRSTTATTTAGPTSEVGTTSSQLGHSPALTPPNSSTSPQTPPTFSVHLLRIQAALPGRHRLKISPPLHIHWPLSPIVLRPTSPAPQHKSAATSRPPAETFPPLPFITATTTAEPPLAIGTIPLVSVYKGPISRLPSPVFRSSPLTSIAQAPKTPPESRGRVPLSVSPPWRSANWSSTNSWLPTTEA